MFRRTFLAVVFFTAVVSGSTTSRAEAIAIDTDTCGDEDSEWHRSLKQAFEQSKLVIDAIVPDGVVCPDIGPCDNWVSPYIDDGDGASSVYEYWFGDPDGDSACESWHWIDRVSRVSMVKDTLMKIWIALREPVHATPYENTSKVFKCIEHLPEPDHDHGEFADDYPYRFGQSGSDNDEQLIYFPRFSDPEVPQFAYRGVNESDIAGFSSRVGVLIHELAHRFQPCNNDMGKKPVNGVLVGPDACVEVTVDADVRPSIHRDCYWDTECRMLAVEDPGLAVINGENYEKFTMYVYMHLMAAQFVALTHPLMY